MENQPQREQHTSHGGSESFHDEDLYAAQNLYPSTNFQNQPVHQDALSSASTHGNFNGLTDEYHRDTMGLANDEHHQPIYNRNSAPEINVVPNHGLIPNLNQVQIEKETAVNEAFSPKNLKIALSQNDEERQIPFHPNGIIRMNSNLNSSRKSVISSSPTLETLLVHPQREIALGS